MAVLSLSACQNTSKMSNEEKANRLSFLVDSLDIPSMQLSVYDKSKGEDYFTVLCGSDKTITPDSRQIYQAASLSKVVFSYIVMRLLDQGKIDLDTPVANYTNIDRFVDKEMASKLTPRMVLTHTTGLYNWAESPSSDLWPTSAIEFHYPADSCYGYSGEGFAFLQRAVEDITGKSLNEVAREYVFEPFDMPLTSYEWIPEYEDYALCGFNLAGENRGRREGLKPNSAFTLRTNSEEYMNFLVHAVLLGEGLSEDTHKLWLTPRSHAIRFAGKERPCDKDIYWCNGMGVKVKFDSSGNPMPKQYWHWGDNGSWKALFVVDPEKGIAMDYFTNSEKGHNFCDEVCELFTGQSYGLQEWIGEIDDD